MPNWKKVVVSGSSPSLNRPSIDDYIVHNGDTNSYMGFNGTDSFVIFTNNTRQISIGSSATTLEYAGNAKLATTNAGIDVTGTLNATSDVVAFYSSDERLKDNIKYIGKPLEKIEKIGGYTYDWNDKQDIYEVGSKDVGVIAQEIEEVLPELVVTRDNGFKAVKYEKIVPLLIESIKELKKEVDDIKKKCHCLNK
jgi:hypothetical protein